MEKFFVYIIQSKIDNTFYKGFSNNPYRRLEEHNEGLSEYTSRKIPWKLVYLEECSNKTEALKREKQLKRANSKYLLWLIAESGRNQIN